MGQATIDDLNDALGNIDAVSSRFLDDDGGGRLATYGGTGIYSGGAYDAFRRSDNIEDRRNQKYSQNPQGPTKITFEDAWRKFTDEMWGSTSAMSQSLGINDIFKLP
jgi:hypothetical protein